jgi:hypothetical protein
MGQMQFFQACKTKNHLIYGSAFIDAEGIWMGE